LPEQKAPAPAALPAAVPLPAPKPEENGGGPRPPSAKERSVGIPAADPAKPAAKMEPKPVPPGRPARGPTGLPLIGGKFAPPSETRLLKPNVAVRLEPLQIRIGGEPLAESPYKDRVIVRWRIEGYGDNPDVPLERPVAAEISAKDLRMKLKTVRIQATFAIRPPSVFDGSDRPVAETDWLELPVKNDCQYDIGFDLDPKGEQLLHKEVKADAE
jgi:hypothetical protein